jgi:hypothetical protein
MSNKETNEDTYVLGLTDSLQNLSFDQLLKELGIMKLKLGVIIPLIFEKGKEKGLNEIEIRDIIKKTIDMPERTLNPYLPEGAKRHKYPKNRELANSANYNEITLNYSMVLIIILRLKSKKPMVNPILNQHRISLIDQSKQHMYMETGL